MGHIIIVIHWHKVDGTEYLLSLKKRKEMKSWILSWNCKQKNVCFAPFFFQQQQTWTKKQLSRDTFVLGGPGGKGIVWWRLWCQKRWLGGQKCDSSVILADMWAAGVAPLLAGHTRIDCWLVWIKGGVMHSVVVARLNMTDNDLWPEEHFTHGTPTNQLKLSLPVTKISSNVIPNYAQVTWVRAATNKR